MSIPPRRAPGSGAPPPAPQVDWRQKGGSIPPEALHASGMRETIAHQRETATRREAELRREQAEAERDQEAAARRAAETRIKELETKLQAAQAQLAAGAHQDVLATAD